MNHECVYIFEFHYQHVHIFKRSAQGWSTSQPLPSHKTLTPRFMDDEGEGGFTGEIQVYAC